MDTKVLNQKYFLVFFSLDFIQFLNFLIKKQDFCLNLMKSQISDTIIALSTPAGMGAIAVIRLSGEYAIRIANEMFKGKDLQQQASHTLHFGKLMDGKEEVDEVVAAVFKSPHSYTKEDVVEISCHGSPFIVNKIITLFLAKGVRLATPGEFTQRAFMNGRFDLSQAEAVADLIASDSQAGHKIAMQQMRGGISQKLKTLRTALIEFTALLELELDFSEEDVEFADRSKLIQLLHDIRNEIATLAASFKLGNAIKNGIPVAIIGKPNAGKSTLLNALLEEERAIVSSIAGTTRDTIEETLTIEGYLFRFIDTAGLREANDEIEKIGIERSLTAIENATITLYISDYTEMDAGEVFANVHQLKLNPENTILVANKTEVLREKEGSYGYYWNYNTVLENFGYKYHIAICAKEKYGIKELKNALVNLVLRDKVDIQNTIIITNVRHYEALQKSEQAIDEVLIKLEQKISSDFIAQDIKIALRHIGEITGDIDIDKDILGTIFGKFCIGK